MTSFKTIFAIATAAVAFLGCASTGGLKRLEEPLRTNNYVSCLMAGLPVTVCQCVERDMFDLFTTEDKVIKGFQDSGTLNSIVQNCIKEIMPEIEKNTGFPM